jgi:hypothetical protein
MHTSSHFINGESVTCPGAVTCLAYHRRTGQMQARQEHGDGVILAKAVEELGCSRLGHNEPSRRSRHFL